VFGLPQLRHSYNQSSLSKSTITSFKMGAEDIKGMSFQEKQKISNEKKKSLPFIYTFIAGALGGVSEILVMYPLDVVKTRVQLQTGAGAGGEAYTGMVDCFQKIIRNEGPARLYRGITAPILMEAPKR
jgi:hypothetical protein